ncbi:hypothetical protein ACJ41O_003293 [Fusarium nematophilum]
MPHHSRQRSTASVDQLFELVEGLDEDQIHTLLEDLNNTVASNIPVSHGIDFFEHPQSPKSTPARSPSIRRSAFKLPRLKFTRTPSKRQSSAPTPMSRPRTAVPPAGPKHYRRISRPVLPTVTSGPDLDALLSAYLAPLSPRKATGSVSTTSPVSTRSIMSSSSTMSFEAEDVVDSLAPMVFGRPQRETSEMGDIFEVLNF